MRGLWYLRIVPGIRHTFPLRYAEWILAVGVVVWGSGLTGLIDYAMVGVGVARLAALTINGTFHDTIYARYSPIVRGVCAFLSALLWFYAALAALSASSQGAVTYPILFVLEVFTAYYVSGESGDTLRAHRNGRQHGT